MFITLFQSLLCVTLSDFSFSGHLVIRWNTTRWSSRSYDNSSKSPQSAPTPQLKARHWKSISRPDKEVIAIDNNLLEQTGSHGLRLIVLHIVCFRGFYFSFLLLIILILCYFFYFFLHFSESQICKRTIKNNEYRFIWFLKWNTMLAWLEKNLILLLFIASHVALFSICWHSCLLASELRFCWGSKSIIVSLCVSQRSP